MEAVGSVAGTSVRSMIPAESASPIARADVAIPAGYAAVDSALLSS